MNVQDSIQQLWAVNPANALLIGGLAFFIAGCFKKKIQGESQRVVGAFACLSILAVSAISAMNVHSLQAASNALFAADSIAFYGVKLALFCGVLLVLLGRDQVPLGHVTDYYGCFLLMLSGVVYLSASTDMIAMFLSMELISIPTVVLLSITQGKTIGMEATLKYFILASFSSAIFLFGASYLYGATGSTSIAEITEKIGSEPTVITRLAIALLLCGLFFRVTAVPFHFYAPDVFKGSTLTMSGVLAVIPKVAGFIALIRVSGGNDLSAGLAPIAVPMLLIAATITMTVGNCAGLIQSSGRGFLAYSSISHSGYLLLALASVLAQGGAPTVMLDYLMVYAAMTVGLVAVMMGVEQSNVRSGDIELSHLDALYSRNGWLAAGGSVCLLSLAGLPLTAGFWAKLQVFIECLDTDRMDVRLATVCMAVNAAIAAVYYLGLIYRFYLPSSSPSTRLRPTFSSRVTCIVASVTILYWFIFP